MFNFGIDKKTIIIVFIVFIALNVISGGIGRIIDFIYVLPAVLIALTFHEFAHAYTAYKLGDNTPKIQGRLNLNPLSHIDPIGFIILAVAGFGWGKPVQIDSRNFDSKYSISKAEAIVAAAGPIMNFILAFIFVIIYYVVGILTVKTSWINPSIYSIINQLVLSIISINIGLGVFNLIPLPPLDGSKILINFLSYNAKQWFYNNSQFFYIGFLLLWITGLSNVILTPIFNGVLYVMDLIVGSIFKMFF